MGKSRRAILRASLAKAPQSLHAARIQEAIAFHQQGQLGQAEAVYREILAQAPTHFDALHLLGVLEYQKGRYESAVELIGQAIRINPGKHAAYSNVGLALQVLQRPVEALASYDRALALKPDSAEALNNRGTALYQLKCVEEALVSYDRALALTPRYSQALNNRGNALRDLKRPEEALDSFNRALALKPDYAEALNGRGTTLNDLKRPGEALDSFESALALNPDFSEALSNRGTALVALGRLQEALDSYARAQALMPEFAGAHYNESLCRLLIGDFERGWEKHEWRWRDQQAKSKRAISQPLWTGEFSIADKTVLLHAEQGFGDTIQFCRYAKLVADRGARVLLEVQRPLASLLARLEGVCQLLGEGDPLPEFDYHCPLLSLPLAFNTRLDTIPADTPYVTSEREHVKHWRAKVGEKTVPRVGLVWSGSPGHKNDANRSIPLGTFATLLSCEAQFVSLQREVRPSDKAVLETCKELVHFGDELKDFADTAALVELMDVVITVDTSVAHLAGAMGKPVWIFLPLVPDWRWLLQRTDSPWYPTARLFRQPTAGDWASVIERAGSELQRLRC